MPSKAALNTGISTTPLSTPAAASPAPSVGQSISFSSATPTASDNSRDGAPLQRCTFKTPSRPSRFRAAAKRAFHASVGKVKGIFRPHHHHRHQHNDDGICDAYLFELVHDRYPRARCACSTCGDMISGSQLHRTKSCRHVVCMQCASLRMLDGIFSCPVCGSSDQLSRSGEWNQRIELSGTRWWPRVLVREENALQRASRGRNGRPL